MIFSCENDLTYRSEIMVLLTYVRPDGENCCIKIKPRKVYRSSGSSGAQSI